MTFPFILFRNLLCILKSNDQQFRKQNKNRAQLKNQLNTEHCVLVFFSTRCLLSRQLYVLHHLSSAFVNCLLFSIRSNCEFGLKSIKRNFNNKWNVSQISLLLSIENSLGKYLAANATANEKITQQMWKLDKQERTI